MNLLRTKSLAVFMSTLFTTTSLISAAEMEKITEENESKIVMKVVGAELPNWGLPNWDLSSLYSGFDDPAWSADWQQLKIDAETFEAQYKGKFKNSGWTADDLLGAIQDLEAFSAKQSRISEYSSLRYYVGLNDAAVLAQNQKTDEYTTELANHFIFFNLELNENSDEAFQNAYTARPELLKYKPYFDDVREEKPHQRSEEVEKVVNDFSPILSGYVRLHDVIESDMRFTVDGKELILNDVWTMLEDSNPSVRRKAAEAMSKSLDAQKKTFASILNMIAKAREINDQTFNFKGLLDSRNLANQVESEVVDAMVVAIQSKYSTLSHRYYRIKKEMLGLETFSYWDRNAALPGADRKYSWVETKEIVLNAYSAFSPTLAVGVKHIIDANKIDVYPREGKDAGAFCTTHSNVLLNHNGTFSDVLTAAHEVGHGVHFLLSEAQGPLLNDAPLTLCETASIFGEMLTFRSVVNGAKTLREKQSYLASKIDAMVNTAIRQTAFHLFEVEVHQKRREGELSVDDLDQIWMKVQHDALGASVKMDPVVKSFWAFIPHFVHMPFYVYAYSFADCVVNSLYAVYQKSPEGFEEKYLDLLRAGGSKRHKELLAPFGLDATDPGFWAQGLSMIEGLIDELEETNGLIAAEENINILKIKVNESDINTEQN
jgi:oligoendopeptidase F